jgi:hypothetical protein
MGVILTYPNEKMESKWMDRVVYLSFRKVGDILSGKKRPWAP